MKKPSSSGEGPLDPDPEPSSGPEEDLDEARRDALKRLGLFGASAAPAMMLLFTRGNGPRAKPNAAVTTTINVTTGSTTGPATASKHRRRT
jgi:hypothetical protein